jgi:hypothetical protein
VAIVCGSDNDGYAIYDYIRARVGEAGSPPFDPALPTGTILRLIRTKQLFRIGWSAYDRSDNRLAERAWITQLQCREGDPVLGPLVS